MDGLRGFLESRDLGKIELLMLSLVFITGLIHIHVGYLAADNQLLLAGLGFLGGAAVFATGWMRNLVVAAAIPYTLIQVYMFYQVYGFNPTDIGIFDKTVQITFLLVSGYYLYRNR